MAWIVVMTKPNSEAIAVENLKRQGFEFYFPRILTLKGSIKIIRPLFPRYLFVKSEDSWYPIKSTRGVSYVLLADNGPATVPDSLIEELRSKENERGLIVIGEGNSPERFSEGDCVRATEGPLTGLDLIYEGRCRGDAERVRVLADLLGRKVPVTIDDRVLVSGKA